LSYTRADLAAHAIAMRGWSTAGTSLPAND